MTLGTGGSEQGRDEDLTMGAYCTSATAAYHPGNLATRTVSNAHHLAQERPLKSPDLHRFGFLVQGDRRRMHVSNGCPAHCRAPNAAALRERHRRRPCRKAGGWLWCRAAPPPVPPPSAMPKGWVLALA
eukprot:CAMPEP_0118939130 /NCGR_PEP_ID=MMETSP1169-20130426/28049_1 /TAXON_ID=36882 /ORGANISM="Pyramimonas obovata, Strain CCMP722" /LENGTH=128 /DNA_ID=CAMNT_0006883319 /DNA_START=68 /DNA_END=451 /DNA_ORIENTATION=-